MNTYTKSESDISNKATRIVTVIRISTPKGMEMMQDKKQNAQNAKTEFSPTLQNKGTTDLALIDGTMFGQISPNTNGTVYVTINGTRVESENGALAKKFNTSTLKLLDAIIQKFSASNTYGDSQNTNKDVVINLDDYLDLIGKPHDRTTRDNIRKQVKKDLDLLYGISLNWTDDKDEDFKRIRLSESVGIENSKILFTVTEKFSESIITSKVLSYPVNLMRLRSKHAYYIGRKLATYANDNRSKYPDGVYLLSVQTLLKSCPSLPSYEELKEANNRNYAQRIQMPFEKAMEELGDTIFYWQYCGPKRTPLTPYQTEHFNFDTFYNAYILYSYNEKGMEAYNFEDVIEQ